IRMSDAIARSFTRWQSGAAGGGRFGFLLRGLYAGLGRVPDRQRDADERAMRAPPLRRGVLERERAPGLLGRLETTGEPRPRALVALGGHIGLDQPVAIVLGQTGAVVDDFDHRDIAAAAHLRLDAPAPAGLPVAALGVGLHGFLGILYEVDDGLRDQPA